MNLPVIQPMRNNQKPSFMPQEQFGLGIQVFKIQAGKDQGGEKGRKTIKQIENPKKVKQPKPPQPVPSHIVKTSSDLARTPNTRKSTAERKQRILPSLSLQKKQFSRDSSLKERGLTAEKKLNGTNSTIREPVNEKWMNGVPEPIKEWVPVRKPEKKASATQHANKGKELPPPPKQKTITHVNFIGPMNQLTEFETNLQERREENAKQVRRLRRLNQTAEVEVKLQQQLWLREGQEMVYEMTNRQQLEGFAPDEPYDEFGFDIYCANGFKFVPHKESRQPESQPEEEESSDEDDQQ